MTSKTAIMTGKSALRVLLGSGWLAFSLASGASVARASEEVAVVLADLFRSQQAAIERNVQRSVKIQSDPSLKWEDFRIVLE